MFFQPFNSRSSVFRTSASALMEPPGPYVIKNNVTLPFGPGKKCKEIMKAFDYNEMLSEGLKTAAEKKRRERKPLSSQLTSRGEVGKKARGKVSEKGRKGRGKAILKQASSKLNTTSDQVVEIANSEENEDVHMKSEDDSENSDSASSANDSDLSRRSRGRRSAPKKQSEHANKRSRGRPRGGGRGEGGSETRRGQVSVNIPLDEINDALSQTKL